jgi:hypothetical protein
MSRAVISPVGEKIKEDVGKGYQSMRVEVDDEADRQGHEADDDEIIIDGIDRLLLRIEGRVDLHALFVDVVSDRLVGRRRLPEALENVGLRPHRELVDRRENVPFADAGPQEGFAPGIDHDGPQAVLDRRPDDAVRDVAPANFMGDVQSAQGENGKERSEDEDQRFLHRHPKN